MRRTNRTWLLLSVAAVMVVTGLLVVACGGGGSAGPEQTVRQVLAAIQDKDIDSFWETIDPQFYEAGIAMGVTEEAMKAMLAEEVLSDSQSISFSDVEMETQMSDDGQTATVTIVGGEATIVEDGETRVEDVKDSGEPMVFDMVLRDGKWYWDISALGDTGGTAAEDSLTTASSEATATTESADDGDWTTLATLQSTDSPWEGLEGLLVSEPFTVSGDARLVLDMPDATDDFAGVFAYIVPADLIPAADDPMGWADLIMDESVMSVTVLTDDPTEEISGLDGTYVLFAQTYEGEAAWALELQTQP